MTASKRASKPGAERQDESSIGLLNKVAAMLDAFGEQGELTASEVAASIGEPRSTVYRLLSNLQTLGLVEATPARGKFRLGTKLFRLGSQVAERFDGRQQSLPAMERLHEETEHTVFFCIREGDGALCVERIDGRWVRSMSLRVGTTLPLHVGGAGKALLAFTGRDAWEDYLAGQDLEAVTEASLVDPDALVRELEETRRRGYSVSDQDVVFGIAALGAPVFDHRGQLCASLSISGVKPSILGENEQRNAEALMRAARDISLALGYDPAAGSPGAPAVSPQAVEETTLKAMPLGDVAQIGIVVRDLDASLKQYSEMFGLDRWIIYTYSPATVPELAYRGEPGAFSMKLALAGSDPQIELIEPLEGRSIYTEWMEEHGEGIHHLGIRVSSLDAALEVMAEEGHELVQMGRGYGIDGDGGFAYFDTEETLGIITEAIEVPAQRRVPDAVFEAEKP